MTVGSISAAASALRSTLNVSGGLSEPAIRTAFFGVRSAMGIYTIGSRRGPEGRTPECHCQGFARDSVAGESGHRTSTHPLSSTGYLLW